MMLRIMLTAFILFLALSSALAQQCTQAQLNTEFTSDPTNRTYASCAASDDQCVLDKFNAPCTDAACKVDQIISREMLYEAIDSAEYLTLMRSTAANDTARVRALDHAMSLSTFNMAQKEVRDKLLDIFPAPSAPITNAAIVALQQRNVPRSQIVCGRPATLCDVSLGRRGDKC